MRILLSIFGLMLMVMPLHAGRYALLVGHSSGGRSVSELKFAESDAARFSELLTGLAGFTRESVVLLARPDSLLLDAELQKMRQKIHRGSSKENDLVLFYYSGHADGQDLLLGNSRFPLERIRSIISEMPASIRIGIFDACQSGAVTAFKGGTRAEPFFLKSQQKIKGEVYIASSAASERAQESETLKGSIFSFHLFNGLRGSADLSSDRKVTLNEAYQYAYRKTVETTALTGGEIQHPVYRFNIHGQGDIVLTDLSSGSAGVVFDATCRGKFLVLSDNYIDVYADFFKKDARDFFVALEPGSYTVVNADGPTVSTHSFAVTGKETYRLSVAHLSSNTLVESRIKGTNPDARRALERPGAPLSGTRWGVGIAGMGLFPVSDGSSPIRPSLAIHNKIYLREHLDLATNMVWIAPGLNLGVGIGFDIVARSQFLSPAAGAGAGIIYLEKDSNGPVQAGLGASVSAHIGLTAQLSKRLDFSFILPYRILMGEKAVQAIGLEAQILLSGRYRDIRVLND